jgi:hypothetical protein
MNNDHPLLPRLNWYWIFQLAGWSFLPLMMTASMPAEVRLNGLIIASWGALSGIILSDIWHRILKRRIHYGIAVNWAMMLRAVLVLGVINTGTQTLGYALIKPFGEWHGVAWLPAHCCGGRRTWSGTSATWRCCRCAAPTARKPGAAAGSRRQGCGTARPAGTGQPIFSSTA